MSNAIIGLAEQCYEGVLIIRGFATSTLLVKHSEIYTDFQRDITTDHVNEIIDFIKAKDTVFMPEIILSYDYCNLCSDEPKDFFAIFNGHPVVHDIDNGLVFHNLKHKSLQEKIFKIELPEDGKQKPFSRIDGNHRLEALATIDHDLKIPYCIVLFCSQTKSTKDREIIKHEMSIFHNLNAKGKILSTEEQYKGLFNLFSVGELETIAPELIPVKEFAQKRCDGLLDELQPFLLKTYPHLQRFFVAPIECLIELFKMIKSANIEATDIVLHDILSYLNILFQSHRVLQGTKCNAILGAYVFFAAPMDIQAKKKVESFTQWICSSQMYSINYIETNSLIKIYSQIYSTKDKQIFVAMPFDDNLDFVFDSILHCIEQINQDYGLELPKPIRIDKKNTGFSYDIVQTIFDGINNAGLLIADLTYDNPNVFFEAGYAQALIDSKIGTTAQILYLISNPQFPDDPFMNVKFDVRNYKMISYKNSGNGASELERKLMDELKAFYNIGE